MEAKQEWIIYVTTNLAHPNKKVYVGQKKLECTNKDNTYLGSGVLIKKAIKKYGKENFNREILVYCYSQIEADKEEVYWIKQLEAKNPEKGYNLSEGGAGVTNCTNKHIVCVETGEKFESVRLAAKHVKLYESSIIRCCQGKSYSAGGFQWRYLNGDKIEYVHKPRVIRKVYCLTNNTIYDSIKQAAKELNLRPTSITSVCKGDIQHTFNYVFKYLDDKEVTKQKIKIKCVDNGMIFNSIGEASKIMKVPKISISNQLKGIVSKNMTLQFIKLTD